jgi:hypothetical protein
VSDRATLANGEIMKLVRMVDGKIGLFVLLPNGAYAIDIASNLGFFFHEPRSYSLLNGALKDGPDWSLLVKHWTHLRAPLKKLQNIALASPDHSLVLQPLAGEPRMASAANPIVAIEITDAEILEEEDSAGLRAMEPQFKPPPESEPPGGSTPTKTAQVIDLASRKGGSWRK